MQSRAFYSSAVSLIGVLALLSVQANIQSMESNESKTIPLLLAAEESDFDRTQLEQNTDQIVRATVTQQIRLGNSESELIEQSIQRKLESYYSRQSSETIQFYSSTTNPKPYQKLVEKKNQPRGLKSLKLWKVLVVSPKRGTYWVNVNYSGGLNKDQALYAVIDRKQSKSVFAVPVGFEQQYWVIGP